MACSALYIRRRRVRINQSIGFCFCNYVMFFAFSFHSWVRLPTHTKKKRWHRWRLEVLLHVLQDCMHIATIALHYFEKLLLLCGSKKLWIIYLVTICDNKIENWNVFRKVVRKAKPTFCGFRLHHNLVCSTANGKNKGFEKILDCIHHSNMCPSIENRIPWLSFDQVDLPWLKKKAKSTCTFQKK